LALNHNILARAAKNLRITFLHIRERTPPIVVVGRPSAVPGFADARSLRRFNPVVSNHSAALLDYSS
jgi:hypothetical protein